MAAAVPLALSGCSPGLDYPSIFPAVHDMPPPRPDTTMDADQVQRATEALISERDHLSAQAQGAGQDKTGNAGADAAKKSAAAAKPPAAGQAAAAATSAPAAVAAGTQTAGAEAKP